MGRSSTETLNSDTMPSRGVAAKAVAGAEDKKLFISSLAKPQAHRYLAGWLAHKLASHNDKNPWLACTLLTKLFDSFWYDPKTNLANQMPVPRITVNTNQIGEELNYTNANVSLALKKLADLNIVGRKAHGRCYLYYYQGEEFPQFIESDRFIEEGKVVLRTCEERLTKQTKRKNARGKSQAKTRNPIPLHPKPLVGNFTVAADELVTEGLRTLTTCFNELIYDEGGNKEARQASKSWFQLLTDIRNVSDIEDNAQALTMLDDILRQAEKILAQTLAFAKALTDNVAADNLLQETHLLTAGIYGLRLRLKNQRTDLGERLAAFKRSRA